MSGRLPELPAAAFWVVLAILSGGCAAPRADAPDTDAGSALRSDSATREAADFESRQRERATALLKQGRLAEAAVAFEVLGVLRPDSVDYREQGQQIQRQIKAAVAERMQRATEAQKRGELEAAAQGYLSVLAVQPDHVQAADALRGIERERNRRTALNRTARQDSAPKPTGSTKLPVLEPAAATSPPSIDRNELEHAAMLTIQGEFDDAIQLLERRLSITRQDEVVRALLADAYFQKAEDLAGRDKAGAIAALENTVRLYPAHPLAAMRLKQLKAVAATEKGPAPSGQRTDSRSPKS